MHKNNIFPSLSFIGFHPFIQGLSASAPRSWYASLLGKFCCRYQPSRANSKISFKVGHWHSSPPLRRETAAAEPSFLAAAMTDLITALKIFKGLLDIDPNLVFHPYKVLQCTSHRQRIGSAFSVKVVKYWNKLQASVVTAPSVDVFKKRSEKVGTEVFPHLPH